MSGLTIIMSYINNENFAKAVQFIYQNIDKPITLEHIADNLAVSISSLKRLFQGAINQSPAAFIRRLRMELAFRSLQSKTTSILEVALASGFEDHSAFSRQFKDTFGYSPSSSRKKLNIVNELDHVSLEEPDIVELSSIKIQSVTETGLYFECAAKAWNILKEKLITSELSDDFSGLFIGFGHDNPHDGSVAEDKMRYTAGINLVERDLKVEHVTLGGGYYARFRYFGKANNLGLAYHYIFGKWSQNSTIKIDKLKPTFQIFDRLLDGLQDQQILINVPLLI